MKPINVQIPDWALPLLRPARFKSIRGGRGSSKSWTVSRIMIMRMAGLLPFYPVRPVNIVSARDFNTRLNVSVKKAVSKNIELMGLEHEFEIYNTEIRHKNGSSMIFSGVTRSVDSFLSMEDIDIFWMEQAECLQDEMIMIEPTIRKPGSELWFVWNPNRRADYCWRRFVVTPEPDDVSLLVNFNDNPWWTAELERTRLFYQKNEPSLYSWMWLGEPLDEGAENQVLPYAMLEKCVQAYEHKPDSISICDFGFDIAEGGRDKCCTVGRMGPRVEHIDVWPGTSGDLYPAAVRATNNVRDFPESVFRMYYDASSPMRGPLLMQNPTWGIRGINFGGKVGGERKAYETGRSNADTFTRRNIQMGQALRLRAMRSVRLVNGEDVDPEMCLMFNPNLPNLEMLLAECTKPIRRTNPTTGRWEIDKRGGDEEAKSPDRFDALCLAFARDSDSGLRART